MCVCVRERERESERERELAQTNERLGFQENFATLLTPKDLSQSLCVLTDCVELEHVLLDELAVSVDFTQDSSVHLIDCDRK